jgi:hypothetical protein
MKTAKRFLTLVAISIALVFTLFGCSSNDDGGNPLVEACLSVTDMPGGALMGGEFVIPDGDGADGSIGKVGQPRGTFPNLTTVWDPNANGGQGGMVPITSVDGASTDNNVHGFGTVGAQIPAQRAGELILTAFPSNADQQEYKAWQESAEYKYFGLPPMAVGGDIWWGEADPTVQALGGGYAFVKNGFPNESNTKGQIKVSPTRCTTEIDENGDPLINCLNFSLIAVQPFMIAVTVYDQSGNFVTEYREEITSQEYRNIIQTAGFLDNYAEGNKIIQSHDCRSPNANNYGAPNTLSTNGFIKVNVNIYPISNTGKYFKDGIYKIIINRIALPYDMDGACVSSNGIAIRVVASEDTDSAEICLGWNVH